MKIGLSIINIDNIEKYIFTNGIYQNIVFLYDYFNKVGYDCWMISNKSI